ncbi:MAG: TIGR00730 family Rossman fold protein [Opitutales bacterium]|nr:TIGR00730 family Rossman fold protein [Opitutales bacterium]
MRKNKIEKIAVYCGAAAGTFPAYADAARELGRLLARENIEIIYGAGCVGLMGVLADSALECGGAVTGVVPRQFVSEVVHRRLTKIVYTNSMAERKQKMAELADAHIALAGGFGTLDEISEALALLQLGISNSPCGFLNTSGFYDSLGEFLARASEHGMLAPNHFSMALFDENPEKLLDRLRAYERPQEKLYWRNFK